MDKALVGIGPVTWHMEVVAIVITVEHMMRKNAKLTAGNPLKNGKCTYIYNRLIQQLFMTLTRDCGKSQVPCSTFMVKSYR